MNLSLVRAAKALSRKKGLAWLFANPAGFLAAPSHRKLPSVPTVNASMDEFIRLLHTNGYDSKLRHVWSDGRAIGTATMRTGRSTSREVEM
jgi:hypothetical protein